MRRVLPVVLHPQEDGPGFLAICPTLPGCHPEGETVGASLDHVQAAAEALWAWRREDGLPGPTPEPGAESGRTAMQGQITILPDRSVRGVRHGSGPSRIHPRCRPSRPAPAPRACS